MDIRFRPPKKSDDKQWEKVQFLVKNGFNFQKVYRIEGSVWHREKYPKNLNEAKKFVEKFKNQAIELGI
jgi:hypothetical protein